ncbi:MAG: TonB-dependent receptor [Gammaproteobacteria bacterium]
MRQPKTSLAAIVISCCMLLTASPSSFAQGALEEIIVTAQKREENIAEVPVAVSVISGDLVGASFSNNMEDLQQLVPSVSIRQGNTTRNQALTVRGIGTISFSIAAEPSVSTVVDNVVLGRSGQAFGDLYDIERVEVLRGPQGTLFGKNASAGVVNISTRKPSDELEGYINASYYQDNEYLLRGRLSGPINDQLRGSVTILDAGFDGFITNVYNNEKVNGYDKRGVRGMLDYDVDDNTSVRFIYEDYEANNDCCADLELRPSGRNPASEAAPNGTGLDLDQRLIDHDFETRTLDSTTASSVQVETGIGEHTLTSITAFRSWDNTEFREGDFTSIAGDSNQPVFGVPFQLHDIGPQEWRQFSQELRLSSPVGENFDYQVGLFYWNIDSERNFTREASCQNNNGQLDAAIANHLALTLEPAQPNTQADVDAFIAANNITCNANDIVSATGFMNTEFNNYAVFGQGNWHLTDTWNVLFGLRYTEDEVSFNHNRVNNDEFGRRGVGVRPRFSDGNNQTDTNLSGSTDESNVAGKLGVQWDFADGAMAYLTYSQGYKGPAFNVFYNMDEDDINPIDAEESDSIELGMKYSGNWGLIAVSLYQTDIENFQANDFDTSDGTTITGFTNGGDVETSGIEIDFIWQVTDTFRLSGGLASSDAESSVGDPLPFAPDLKYSLVGQYDMPLRNGATVRFNGNYVYTDEKLSGNIGQTDEVPFLLPDFGLLNASIGYHSENEKLALTLVAKNLTDESFATTFAGDGFRYTVPRDADRYFGVNLRLNY